MRIKIKLRHNRVLEVGDRAFQFPTEEAAEIAMEAVQLALTSRYAAAHDGPLETAFDVQRIPGAFGTSDPRGPWHLAVRAFGRIVRIGVITPSSGETSLPVTPADARRFATAINGEAAEAEEAARKVAVPPPPSDPQSEEDA